MGLKLFADTYALLRDRRVPLMSKITFVTATLGYLLSPDLLPFLPFDDLFMMWLASKIFVRIASKQAGYGSRHRFFRKKDKGAIDIEGEIIE